MYGIWRDAYGTGVTQAVLYEILLRLGLKLTVKVRSENQVFWVEDENGHTFALMLTEINDEMIEKVIATQPKKVVTLARKRNRMCCST